MNHVYRVVWSVGLGMYQVASEIACGHSGKSRSVDRRQTRKAAAAAALVALSGVVQAVPAPYAGILTQSDNNGFALSPGNAMGWFPVWDWNGTDLNITMTGVKTVSFNNLTGQIQVGAGAAIYGGSEGIVITATSLLSNLSTLTNNGTVSGSQTGVTVAGALGSIANNGLISNGLFNAAAVQVSGTVGTLTNTGAITGASDRGNGITVAPADPALPALLNRIDNTGTISGGTNGINNAGGAIGTISNNVAGTVTGTIKGQVGIINTTNYLNGTLVAGSLDRLENSGLITGTDVGIANASTIGTIHNNASGLISGTSSYGIRNALGQISAIENSGNITGGIIGVQNLATITSVDNVGQISGVSTGLANTSHISTLTNSGTIAATDVSVDAMGLVSTGQFGALSNSGLISGFNALVNQAPGNGASATLGTLTNSGTIAGAGGTISSAAHGVANYGGTIGTINNLASGKITATGTNLPAGVYNSASVIGGTMYGGTINAINNAGLITGDYYAIYNTDRINTINNLAGGVITASGGAISNQDLNGSIGQINNAGTIGGWIINRSVNDMRISGATDSTFGTLTGVGGGVGTIVSTSADVHFNGGNLLVNDNFDLNGTRTAYNDASVLQVNRALQVAGNYAQATGATLQIGVANNAVTTGDMTTDSGYGRLVVSGNTTLAVGSNVALQSLGYSFAPGQRYVVIDTAGTANYNADSLVYKVNGSTTLAATGAAVTNGTHQNLVVTLAQGSGNNGGTPSGGNGGNSGGNNGGNNGGSEGGNNGGTTPAFDPRSYATIASNPNAVSSLRGLLGYTGVSDLRLLNLYNATLGSLSDNSTSSANRVGQQLAPVQHIRAAGAATIDALGVVNTHVNSLRLAQAGGTGVATGDGASNWGVWGEAFGGHASQSARDDVDGYSSNYGGLLVGADRAFGDHWRAGGAFQFSRTVINNDGSTSGNNTSVNGYGLIGYATFTGQPWYVNVSGSAVMQRYNSTRMVSMQGFNGVASGSANGQQYVASAEFGYPLAVGRAVVTPLANLTYSYLNQNSYTETGGNGTALSVSSASASSVRSALGAKFALPFDTSYGSLVPELSVRWVHEYNRTRLATGASFAADPIGQTGFTTVGATPVSDLADISLGLTLLRANNLSASVRYQLQAGSGFISHTGIVRVQQRF